MEISTPADRPEIRRSNLLQLFSEYVAKRMAQAPSEQINGLDREFAALIQVHNTYFSGMKSGARTIGDKLARQIETLCAKEKGWLDEPHEVTRPAALTKARIRNSTECTGLRAAITISAEAMQVAAKR